MSAKNQDRVDNAALALGVSLWLRGRSDAPENFDEDAMSDLLTDLRHLCEALGFDWERCDRVAAMYFEDER